MYIGHICLAASMNGSADTLISLIEALARQGVRQHVLVRNVSLARRLAICEQVIVGPAVKAPVMAYCLMPNVQVVHIHRENDGSAGLLLTLTRSIPYVLTCRSEFAASTGPLKQSIFNRAAGLIFPDKGIASGHSLADDRVPINIVADTHCGNGGNLQANNRIAAEHLRIYRRAADSGRIPALLL